MREAGREGGGNNENKEKQRQKNVSARYIPDRFKKKVFFTQLYKS